jgi:hypothetical protein
MLDAAAAGLAGLSFAVGFGEFFNVVSALKSSPWTIENMGADAGKRNSDHEYTWHAIIVGNGAFGLAAWLQRQPWILVGSLTASGYIFWLYRRAGQRAQATGSEGWGTGQDTGLKKLFR